MRLAWMAVPLLASACAAPAGLTVDVRTDYQPGTDFDTVQTEVSARAFASASPDGLITSHPAALGDYVRGVRVDERPTLGAGDWYVRVTLLAESGARVAQRAVAVHLTERHSLTVVLARSCEGVTCPSAASPMLTECSGGVCVSPSCSPESPDACPTPACTTDAECSAPGPCARVTCASGVCLAAPDDTRCAGAACGSDFRCAAPLDGGTPDAPVIAEHDAAPIAPTFTLRVLPRGATAWETRTTSGLGPTDEIEAAFAQSGTGEMMVLTHTELFVLRLDTDAFVARQPRDAVFPDLAGMRIDAAVGVNGDLYLNAGGAHDTWVYGWTNATRTATLTQFIQHADLGSDWDGPLAPPWFQVYAAFYVPDNADGWAHDDPRMVCGTSPVQNHIGYLSTDGFGPRAMITTVWDASCFQFVDQSYYGAPDYTAFSYPGAPPSPWEIDAIEYYDGLWVFTSPE